ncbi:hypothetical protein LLEC1_04127 [Akanthomyces lecanii]|uniref:AB hydrolase-1 domain-containing protein n=1 Tax=Cordyceps confragosa TaxID=2714763 RepID=A0A179IF02_CORDF|nr:hypothetical protein LLEC1_04127 [Akanthomyces lecanii]
MLPEPALTFTIPSIHDGIPLDCRIYHPRSLGASSRAPSWRRHAAVLAHPYAPLGGNFDDPVIETVGARILSEGYLLGTFNFRWKPRWSENCNWTTLADSSDRGAGHSAGKTSWTSKPERSDFQSVIAFMAYFIHHLQPSKSAETVTEDSNEPARNFDDAVNRHSADDLDHKNVLVIGGYSYGSLITAQLPPLEAILEPFASPLSASNEAQIRLRAASLADQQNTLIRLTRETFQAIDAKRSPSKRGVRVGGDEGAMSPRRRPRSTDGSSRRSLSGSRELEEKLHELVAKTKASLHHRHASSETTLEQVPEENGDRSLAMEKQGTKEPAEGRLPRLVGFEVPQQAYVLVSPIPGLASHLVTMRLLPTALSRARRPEEDPAEAKLVWHPTLAVHGDADMFVLPYKAREWVARLTGAQKSRFQGVEVPTAGHFWTEEGVMDKLIDVVGEFVHGLVADREANDEHVPEHIDSTEH